MQHANGSQPRHDGAIARGAAEMEERSDAMNVELHGYQHSVYAWIARLALHEKGVAYDWNEINPFSDHVPASYLSLHPFQRVPTLVCGKLVIYETGAITRFVDEAFAGPPLQRSQPAERARCNQVMSIVDNYAYWPLVRQVLSHRVFRPAMGLPSDEDVVRRGLEGAPRVLSALETLAGNARHLCGDELSLADIHLAPMIGYFQLVSEGKSILQRYAKLSNWWNGMSQRASFIATMPVLPRT